MSLESVKSFLAAHAPDLTVIELESSTATVPLAAEAHGVEPGRIAKTLSLRIGQDVVVLVTRGDARLDNQKYKAVFRAKPKMLDLSEVEAETGHPVGGVSPLGLSRPLRVYCDVSLKDFDEVLPAAGATNAAVRISPDRLAALTDAEWVDVTKRAGEPSPDAAPE
ncbi:MAG: YbaK/EbsC family protein [Vicinamibacterales bacterium]